MEWNTVETLFDLAGAVLLGGLTVLDVKNKRIPVICPFVFGVVSFIFRGASMVFDTMLGMAPGAVVIIVSLFSKGQIGIGDGIVIIFLGGMLGGSESVEVLILSLIFVFLFSAVGLLMKKLSKKTALPFIPFYFAAYLGVVYL